MGAYGTCKIRRLKATDIAAVLEIIRDVRLEYGLKQRVKAVLETSDKNLLELYKQKRSAYFVAVQRSRVLGGAGIAPLAKADALTCELQRMYLLADCRGFGIGRRLLAECLGAARSFGYRYCYVETIREMTGAIHLYKTSRFERLVSPLGNTAHPHNDYWMRLDLEASARSEK